MERNKEQQQNAKAYFILGSTYRSENRFESAIEYFKKAWEISKELGDKEEEIKVLYELHVVCVLNEQFQTAIAYGKNALDIAREQGYKELEAKTLRVLGYAYQLDNQFQMALECFEKTGEIAKEFGNKEKEITVLFDLVATCKDNKQISTVIEYSQQALDIAKEQKRKEHETRALVELGDAYNMQNQFQTAIGYFEKALKIAKEQEYNKLEAKALRGLGNVYNLKCQYQTAIEYFEKSLKIAKEQEDKDLEITALTDLADSCLHGKQVQTAIEYTKEIVKLAKQLDKKEKEALSLVRLGLIYKMQDQIQTAIEYLEKGLKLAEELGYKELEVNALNGLGEAYQSKNELQTAIEYMEKVLKIAKEQEYTEREKNVLFQLGVTCRMNHEFQRAIQYVQEGLQIAQRQGLKLEESAAREEIELLSLMIGIDENLDLDTDEDSNKNLKTFGTSDQNEGPSEKRKLENLAVIREQGSNKKIKTENAMVIQDQVPVAVSGESWKWEETSIVHREKFIKLGEYRKTHPEDIKEVNGVHVCCSNEFLIGKGSDGTRVYVGLEKNGHERAVKRLPRDVCTGLAEQEKKVLKELNETKSNYVVKYWFLDEQSDKDYLFIILDLCEETLENFVANSSDDDLVKIAPDIIRQVLKGLADLHCERMPILHRDLKSSNILRNVHDKWLLADFGISRILTEGDSTISSTGQRGTEDWRAVESNNMAADDGKVRFKKESDIQVAGMAAFYIVTKGEHPFGEKRFRLDNLLAGKPVGLDTLKDPVLKDLLSWMLSHDPNDRPSAEQALKHPYLQSKKQQFEMLCKIGNQQEIKAGDNNSAVVRELNNDPIDWKTRMKPDILKYLCTDFINGKPKPFDYKSSWTECLRLIRNVNQNWLDRSRPMRQPEAFYEVGDPQEYFLNLFPNLPVEVHRIVRSCDWKERADLKEYFSKGANEDRNSENAVVIEEQMLVAGANEERNPENVVIIQGRGPAAGANEDRNSDNAVIIEEREPAADTNGSQKPAQEIQQLPTEGSPGGKYKSPPPVKMCRSCVSKGKTQLSSDRGKWPIGKIENGCFHQICKLLDLTDCSNEPLMSALDGFDQTMAAGIEKKYEAKGGSGTAKEALRKWGSSNHENNVGALKKILKDTMKRVDVVVEIERWENLFVCHGCGIKLKKSR